MSTRRRLRIETKDRIDRFEPEDDWSYTTGNIGQLTVYYTTPSGEASAVYAPGEWKRIDVAVPGEFMKLVDQDPGDDA